MQFDFDKIFDRRNTDSLKWDCNNDIFNGENILPMWIADMDFPAPYSVTEAIQRRNGHGIYGYTQGMPDSLKDAIANWVNRRHGWNIEHEWLHYTPGVVSGLCTSVLALTEPGDGIMIQPPVYPPFCNVIKENGRRLISNPLKIKNGRYTMDFDDMEYKMRSGAKMIILCSPHNPVGRVWEREELLQLAKLCLENGVILVSDEIHSDVVFYGRKNIPAASVSHEIEQKSVTCIAASKTFGVAGLTTSAVIIPNPVLRQKFGRKLAGMGLEYGNVFGVVASEAAYRCGEEWLEQLLEYLEGNLRILLEYFKTNIPEIKTMTPEGTYLVWMDCRQLGMSCQELSAFMAEKAKIRLNDGATFGEEGKGFLRMNIACPRAILREGLMRMGHAVKKLEIKKSHGIVI